MERDPGKKPENQIQINSSKHKNIVRNNFDLSIKQSMAQQGYQNLDEKNIE